MAVMAADPVIPYLFVPDLVIPDPVIPDLAIPDLVIPARVASDCAESTRCLFIAR